MLFRSDTDASDRKKSKTVSGIPKNSETVFIPNHIYQCPKVRNKEERKKKELDKSSIEANFVKTLDSGEARFVASVKKCSSWVLLFYIPLPLFIFVRIEIDFLIIFSLMVRLLLEMDPHVRLLESALFISNS